MSFEEKITERPDSIKVSENAKGLFSYEVKIYFDSSEKPTSEIINYIEDTYDYLHSKFKGE